MPLLVVVLFELRRDMNEERGDVRGDVNSDDEGVDVPEDGARCTKDESILYARVDGSSGLSVRTGEESAPCRFEVDAELAW